ncbi:MAG: lipoprotein-releasing ABC transporter permease subunit [SAR116 cluster bacterium]|nr:MAG: lipoprotein-releasing ABC transporter permease subunit [SAR116 cluster bacterium]HCJ61848.1 lipoprotein-releasing ABC transporter permease subunit [Alphaproteobacteria bacterium]
MQLGLELHLASRYLRARKSNGVVSALTIFSFIGIFLGVATLIIVMAVMEGFQKQLTERIVGLNGHVVMHYVDGAADALPAYRLAVENIKGVTKSIPVVEGQGLISYNGNMSGVITRGMPVTALKNLELLARGIVGGRMPEAEDRSVLVGSGLARKLGVFAGDDITLMSPEGIYTPFGQIPRVEAYNVAAIFEVGMTEYDNAYLFMGLEEAQEFFGKPDQITGLELFLDDPNQAPEIAEQALLLQENTAYTTWQQANSAFFAALAVERTMMFIILSLIILVAALNIISGMSMLVRDKSQEIAVLRGMGMSRGAVMRVFMMAGSAIGIAGTVVGVGLALLFSANIDAIKNAVSALLGVPLFDPSIYFLARLPAEVQLVDVLMTVSMALFLTLLATIIPAWRAASLAPAEALRRG